MRRRRHINLGEVRAALQAEEKLSRTHQDCRYVHLQDSGHQLGAAAILGLLLGCRPLTGIRLSSDPPSADDRTRKVPLRRPSKPQGQWFRDFLGRSHSFGFPPGMDLEQLKGLPDPACIMQSRATVGAADSSEESFSAYSSLERPAPMSPVPLKTRSRGRSRLPCLPCEALSHKFLRLSKPFLPTNTFCIPLSATWTLPSPGALAGLLDEGVRTLIEEVLNGCAFKGLTAGPVCSSFSTAIVPAAYPEGVPWATPEQQAKMAMGNSFCAWSRKLLRKAWSLGILAALENPQNSHFWKQPGWRDWEPPGGWADFLVDYCRFGT